MQLRLAAGGAAPVEARGGEEDGVRLETGAGEEFGKGAPNCILLSATRCAQGEM